MRGISLVLAAVASGLSVPGAAQIETPGAVLVGSVDRTGRIFTAETTAGRKRVYLFTTAMQVPARKPVVLTRYAGRRIAVACLNVGTQNAWKCTAIGEMRATVPGPVEH